MITVEVGSIVRFQAPDRNDQAQARLIPAIVMGQWPDGSLQLFAFHFEGSYLVNSMPLDQVQVLMKPQGAIQPVNPAKFSIEPPRPGGIVATPLHDAR
jgi:hypothetical protein